MDISRFGRAVPLARLHARADGGELRDLLRHPYPAGNATSGRPLRTSPAYDWHAAHGAAFGEKAGWERVELLRRRNAAAGDEALRPRGWAGRHWSPAIARRAPRDPASGGAVRRDVVRQDRGQRRRTRPRSWTGCATTGGARRRRRHLHAGAQRARRHRVATSPSPGLADDAFLIVTGTAFGTHDLAWLRRQARAAARTSDRDVTGQCVLLRAVGPRARDILRAAHARRPERRRVPVHDRAGDHGRRRPGAGPAGHLRRRARLGALRVRRVRRDAVGDAVGRRARRTGWSPAATARSRALRLEKGYRVWGTDITAGDDTRTRPGSASA